MIGGCFDPEFEKWSNGIIKDLESGFFQGVTSPIVAAEVANAPAEVKDKYRHFISLGVDVVDVNTQVETLAEAYIGSDSD